MHTSPGRRCHRCGAVLAALACTACGAILPAEFGHHVPDHAQVVASAPAVDAPADAHTHPERESGPPPAVAVQAGGGTVTASATLLGGEGTLTAGGAVTLGATVSGVGTLRAG